MGSFYKNAAVVVLGCLICGVAAQARDHDVFIGTWTLTPSKSDFAGQPGLQSGTVTIFDHEGITSVTRHFVSEAAGETYFYSDMVDSEHNATIHDGKDLKSKTTWDHDTLKVTTTQGGAVTVETYTLAGDGTMAVSVAKPDRPAFTLVFERK
jgi:hypothetical protein